MTMIKVFYDDFLHRFIKARAYYLHICTMSILNFGASYVMPGFIRDG